MPGKHVTEQQLRLYMKERQKYTQKVAAAKAGFSEKTAKRLDQGQKNGTVANDHLSQRVRRDTYPVIRLMNKIAQPHFVYLFSKF